jgi:hypothetical protein
MDLLDMEIPTLIRPYVSKYGPDTIMSMLLTATILVKRNMENVRKENIITIEKLLSLQEVIWEHIIINEPIINGNTQIKSSRKIVLFSTNLSENPFAWLNVYDSKRFENWNFVHNLNPKIFMIFGTIEEFELFNSAKVIGKWKMERKI